jgi:hypothetical protein
VGRRGDDTPGLEGRNAPAHAGGHRYSNGIPDAGHVIVRNPPAEIDDRRLEKRLAVDHLDNVFRLGPVVEASIV